MPTTLFHMCLRLYRGFAYGDPPLEWKIAYTTAVVLWGGLVWLNLFWYKIILKGAIKLFLPSEKTSAKKAE